MGFITLVFEPCFPNNRKQDWYAKHIFFVFFFLCLNMVTKRRLSTKTKQKEKIPSSFFKIFYKKITSYQSTKQKSTRPDVATKSKIQKCKFKKTQNSKGMHPSRRSSKFSRPSCTTILGSMMVFRSTAMFLGSTAVNYGQWTSQVTVG